MSEQENRNPMEMWNTLNQPIPREFLSTFTKDGFTGSEIKSQYRIQRLTEVFGPNGIGWGYKILDKWTENWPGTNLGCCYVMVSLWYETAGTDGHQSNIKETSPQIGGTHVDRAPDECWKSAITDAVGKCASLIGLGADIYLGLASGKYERATTAQQAKMASDGGIQGSRPATAADGKKKTETPF